MAVAKIKNLVILILILLFIIAAIIIVLQFVLKSQDKKDFNELISDIDLSLSRAYYDQSKRQLSRAMIMAVSVKTQLCVLKRARQYAKAKGDFSLFNSFTSQALKKNPGSEVLKNLKFYGLLQTNNPVVLPKGFEKSIKNNLSDLLYMEWYLKTKNPLPSEYSPKDEELKELMSLFMQNNADLFYNLGQKYANKYILKNAALLWANSGSLNLAMEIIKKDLVEVEFDEPAFFLAYDANDYNEALKRIIRLLTLFPDRKDFSILLGDLYVWLSKDEESETFYNKSIKMFPTYSVIPYINLSWIYLKENKAEKAVELLSKAKERFPDNEEVCIQIARFLMNHNRPHDAKNLLLSAYKKNPEHSELAIYALDIQRDTLEPVDFQNALWEIIYQARKPEKIAEYFLSWMFFANAQIEDIQRLISYIQNKNNSDEMPLWFLHFKALTLALTGEDQKAIEILSDLIRINDDLFIKYNRAMIYKINEEFQNAEKDLLEILKNQLYFQSENKSFYSKVNLHLAHIYNSLRRIHEARKNAEKAYLLDNSNQEAQILLKELNES